MLKDIYTRIKSKLIYSNKIPQCALSKNLLFIHIPKAAGSMVSFQLYGGQIGHKKAKYYYLSDFVRYSSVRSFSVVRNPYSRFVSAYNFLNNGGMSSIDKEFKVNIIEKYDDINHFIINVFDNRKGKSKFDVPHFEVQSDYLYYRSTLLVDYVFKLEDISGDDTIIKEMFKVDVAFSKKANVSKEGYTVSDLNLTSLKILQEYYHSDFEHFGYEK